MKTIGEMELQPLYWDEFTCKATQQELETVKSAVLLAHDEREYLLRLRSGHHIIITKTVDGDYVIYGEGNRDDAKFLYDNFLDVKVNEF